MFVSRSIRTNHADLIHDVAFDYYGRRMATCSSDQMIQIWDLRDDQEWVCTARWRNHMGSVWRISWAHPEFGQVIATCSFDRTIAIWEEITGQSVSSNVGEQGGNCGDQTWWSAGGVGGANQGSSVQGGNTTSFAAGGTSTPTSWVRRGYLVDPRTSVTGLQFAPRFLGLQLAAISTDGILRIYEAQDVMNLSQWTLQFDFGTKMTGSCLAWSQSRIDPPLIAVGSSAREMTGVGASSDTGLSQQSSNLQTGNLSTETSSFIRGKLVIYEYSEGVRHWQMVQDVAGLKDSIFDLAFAPSMGQSYHTLAVASTEVIILRVKSLPNTAVVTGVQDSVDESADAPVALSNHRPGGNYEVSIMAKFNQHRGRVWRVSWNITGTLLASAGDDGTVRLWRANYLNVWRPVSVIAPGGSPEVGLPIPPPLFTALNDPPSSSSTTAMPTNVNTNSSTSNNNNTGYIPHLGGADLTGALKTALSEASFSGRRRRIKRRRRRATASDGRSGAPKWIIPPCLSTPKENKPVRFRKNGSMITSRNQVVWH